MRGIRTRGRRREVLTRRGDLLVAYGVAVCITIRTANEDQIEAKTHSFVLAVAPLLETEVSIERYIIKQETHG